MVKQYHIQHHTATENKLRAYGEETLFTRIHMKGKQFHYFLFDIQTETHPSKQHGHLFIIIAEAR